MISIIVINEKRQRKNKIFGNIIIEVLLLHFIFFFFGKSMQDKEDEGRLNYDKTIESLIVCECIRK